MCSILGLIDFECKDQSKNLKINKINNLLAHRGPNDKGYYNDPFISLAFNRLSIMDLVNGNQPVVKNHIITIFNGEIYNFKEIRNELKNFGFDFKTNSDSEIIASAFLKWGIKCIDKFNGMFAIAIYDKKNRKIYLVRDRVGIKPLYYSHLNGSLIFCSEIKGIVNYPSFKKSLNFNALSSYLSFRYPMGENNNFFKHIQKVLPGSYIEINIENKNIQKTKYWSIPAIGSSKNYNEDYYLHKLDSLLSTSIKKQLVSDAPLGVFLSGGLDSSILSSIASKSITGKLKTYSVGFKEKGYDETSKARLISKYIGSEHTEVFVEKDDFFKNLSKIIEIKDTPLSIPHEYPIFLLGKKMKEDIKVVISGEGADEFFGGYSRVQKSPIDFLKTKYLGNLTNYKFLSKIFSIDKNFDFKNSEFLDYFFHKYNWFSFKETNELLSADANNQVDIEEVKSPWKEILVKYSSCNYYEQIMLMFQNNHLECLLDRLDVMTMANSIEARVPFLDHELIEFINTVPFKYKIRWKSQFNKFKSLFSNNFIFSEKYDTNKYLLRKLGHKYLPNQIAREKKLGFPLPMNDWMRDKRIKEILLDKKTLDRNIFNKEKLERLLEMKNLNEDYYDFEGKKIWMLINFELWMRKFLD